MYIPLIALSDGPCHPPHLLWPKIRRREENGGPIAMDPGAAGAWCEISLGA